MTDCANWRPGADIRVLQLRSLMLTRLREWFAAAGVLEVDTPVLSAAGATDPALTSLVTMISDRPFYLHTSPEFPMKRLLAAGCGDIYQVCKAFRDGELGKRHNPEFTLVEWYRSGIGVAQMMDEVEALIGSLVGAVADSGEVAVSDLVMPNAVRTSYRELVWQFAEVDPFSNAEPGLAVSLRQRLDADGIEVPVSVAHDSDALLDMLISMIVEPSMDPRVPVFVYDYPASQASLARIKPGNPPVADRFELYWRGLELANGFRELTDAVEQRKRFKSEVAKRAEAGAVSPPLDENFLCALEFGLPDCTGVALGFDRLLMAICGLDEISSAMSFDLSRA
jgi:lysyl-tRNA synthetase class 2